MHLIESEALQALFEVDVLANRQTDTLSNLGRLNLSKILATGKMLLALVRRARHVDVVYYTPAGWGLALVRDALNIAVCRMLRVPYVLHMHGSTIGGSPAGTGPAWYERLAIRAFVPQAAGLLLVGESTRSAFAAVGRPGQLMRSVENGVAIPDQIEAVDEFRLGFLNNLVRYKGLHFALDVVQQCQVTRFDVVGAFANAQYEAEIQAQIASLALSDTVVFHGRRNAEAAWEALRDVSVLIYTSAWREGLPLVWLEAMARGKVVVTFRVGAADDVVGRVDPALVVAQGDVEAMVSVLKRLRDDSDWRHALAKRSRELATAEFSLAAWSGKVAAAVTEMLETKNKS